MSESDKSQWFVVHVLSGQEQKVFDNLARRIKTIKRKKWKKLIFIKKGNITIS